MLRKYHHGNRAAVIKDLAERGSQRVLVSVAQGLAEAAEDAYREIAHRAWPALRVLGLKACDGKQQLMALDSAMGEIGPTLVTREAPIQATPALAGDIATALLMFGFDACIYDTGGPNVEVWSNKPPRDRAEDAGETRYAMANALEARTGKDAGGR